MPSPKTLLLLRHAKPVWQSDGMVDFDRTLQQLGRAEAASVGEFLLKEEINPDLIVSSPAARTRETIGIIQEVAGLSANVLFEKSIYEATPAQLLEFTLAIDTTVQSALIVGHNPGIESFLRMLTHKQREFSPATLARIALPVESWSEITAASGKLEWIMNPANNLGP